MANSNRNGMAGGNLKGHLALLAAYTIFGVNIVLTKDISIRRLSPLSHCSR